MNEESWQVSKQMVTIQQVEYSNWAKFKNRDWFHSDSEKLQMVS